MQRFKLFSFGFCSTSKTVALASVLSFGTQVVFALLMLRWFTPQEVGEFTVISQIAFFWMTLALAQAPLSLLANPSHNAHQEARKHWLSSVWRWCALAPLAWLALWIVQLQMLSALAWVVLISLCQLSWGLAQSFVLRTGTTRQQLYVRVVPPVCSVLVAWAGSQFIQLTPWQGPALLLAAFIGYFVGSLWLVPAWFSSDKNQATAAYSTVTPTVTAAGGATAPLISASSAPLNASVNSLSESTSSRNTTPQADTRSSLLRLTHTFFDMLLATAVIILWQRLYGAQETGWLSALLRVFGFIPAVIHMAWAQVKLAQPMPAHESSQSKGLLSFLGSLSIGIAGCIALLVMGFAALLALQLQWLDPHWEGITQYLWPLLLWQSCACLSASVSHRPFQVNVARQYSIACIAAASVQIVTLILPPLLLPSLSAYSHMLFFSAVSSMGLLALTQWMHSLRSHHGI